MNQLITGQEYYDITGCTYGILGFKFPEFTFEEVQKFLIKLGYNIIIHEAKATVHHVKSEGVEVRRTGEMSEELRKRIIAVKITENTKLPDRVDSQEAIDLDLKVVFEREIKNKLLGL